ncbi:hypothetical protein PANO111632_13185 [Paracoccus nototheniae]
MAGKDFERAEIAFVGQNLHIVALQCDFRLYGHFGQQIPVMPLIGDLMRDDQMGFGIDNALDVVADMPAVLRACRHGPRVGVGQRYLPVRGIGQRLVNGEQTFDLLADAAISAGQMRHPLGACRAGFLTVNPVGLFDVAADLGLQMRKAAGDLALGEVPVAIVDRFQLAAIDGHDLAL